MTHNKTGIRYHGHDGETRVAEFESRADAERVEPLISDEFDTSTTIFITTNTVED